MRPRAHHRRGAPEPPPRRAEAVLADVAAMLEAAARWAEDQLAGGVPAKWVAYQAAAAQRHAAAVARGRAVP